MSLIIILSVVAIFYINLIFIDRIYKIVEPPTKSYYSEENLNKCVKEALIYGNDDICYEISDLLKCHDISSDILKDVDKIDMSYSYKYLIAVYDDDLENLTACSIAVKIMGINNVLAICNKQYYQKIYEENHITHLNNKVSASEIVFLLLNYQKTREA